MRHAMHQGSDGASVRVRKFVRGIGILAAWLAPLALHAAAFPPEIDLATLDPANGGDGSVGVLLAGQTPDDLTGSAVAAAGDIDGDGISDLLIGASGNGTRCRDCAAFVVFGSSHLGAAFDVLRRPIATHGRAGFIVSTQLGDDGGQAVSSVGDIDDDGIDDFVVADPAAPGPHGEVFAGQAYVVFGGHQRYPVFFHAESLLPGQGGDGSRGFVLKGVTESDVTGRSASGGCDLNVDGIDDLVLGTNNQHVSDPNDRRGAAHVFFGRSTGFPARFDLERLQPQLGGDGSEGVTFRGIVTDDRLGREVVCSPDLNGDGIGDLVMSASSDAGQVFVVFGHPGPFDPTPDMRTLLPTFGGDGSEGFVLSGLDSFGVDSLDAGDVNGDGLADVLVGVADDDGGGFMSGSAWIFFGQSGGFAAEFDMNLLLPENGGDGTRGFVLNGAREEDLAGWDIAAAGDVNGDGIGDLLVGSRGPDIFTNREKGRSYVYFGRSDGFPAEFDLGNLLAAQGGDGSLGFVMFGAPGDQAGDAVNAAGDANGDGIADLLIGAPETFLDEERGRAYLVYGRSE